MSEQHERRIDRVLGADFLDDLASRDEAELRAMREDAREVEHEYSYLRRLAQGRIAILEADQARRARGAPLSDLIEELPKILAGDEPARPAQAQVRVPTLLAPRKLSGYKRGMERLVEDDTLTNLPTLSDDEVTESLDQLRVLEEEVSGIRRKLHGVINQLSEELAARSATGA